MVFRLRFKQMSCGAHCLYVKKIGQSFFKRARWFHCWPASDGVQPSSTFVRVMADTAEADSAALVLFQPWAGPTRPDRSNGEPFNFMLPYSLNRASAPGVGGFHGRQPRGLMLSSILHCRNVTDAKVSKAGPTRRHDSYSLR